LFILGPLERAELDKWLKLALSNGPNRVGISLPSPEGENRSSFWNVLFSRTYRTYCHWPNRKLSEVCINSKIIIFLTYYDNLLNILVCSWFVVSTVFVL
jgi:hypothetical protein